MRNEIIGTFILVLLGSILALPVGLMAGIFLAEFASPKSGGCSSIRGGYSCRCTLNRGWRVRLRYRRPANALILRTIGRRGTGHHHDSRCRPDSRGVTASGAEFDARGSTGSGHYPVAGSGRSSHTRRSDRDCYRE